VVRVKALVNKQLQRQRLRDNNPPGHNDISGKVEPDKPRGTKELLSLPPRALEL